MNITFPNQANQANRVGGPVPNMQESTRAYTAQDTTKKTAGRQAANVSFSAAESNLNRPGLFPEDKDGREKGKTLTDLQQEASVIDVGISQDYMTLMSNTMSEEDYQKLSEEGFDFSGMDPEKAVTIVDKIKAELARSGQQIVGYTDDLDVEMLAQVLGSETLARSVTDAFGAADIPMTEENLEAVNKAWQMARGLETPTEGTYRYMIDNALEPEVWNFYLAQNSGANYGAQGAEASGRDLSYLQDENILRQIDHVLEQTPYAEDAAGREDAMWLLERDLPLTAENVVRLRELRQVQVPVEEETFARAAAEAVAEGKDPVHARLSGDTRQDGTIYEKAMRVLEAYQSDAQDGEETALSALAAQSGDLAARKQLEEIRLRMTAEINVKLLKSGFSIDTAPMEQLIDALRDAEREIADRYFPQDADAVPKYENWNQTNRVVQEMPGLPAQLLGTLRIGMADAAQGTVLAQFHSEGVLLQQAYEKAGESYETLMTAPRADLGDSIRKAFFNVDELARELGLEPVEENTRAVRILGYNHMEITPENVERVKEADARVQDLIRRMTPAATLQMIRDGVNPLEQTFDELHAYFDTLPEDYLQASESYSRYLYGLERNNQITQEERDSYIGVYRLLHQIEKKDGAAVGAVLNEKAQLQFSNLLSAVRSGNFRHMDVKADDELGMLKEIVQKQEGQSITEQISRAYNREQLTQLREATEADREVTAMLERSALPAGAGNLLAAQKLLKHKENPFDTFKSSKTFRKDPEALLQKLADKEQFRAAYEETIEAMQEQTDEDTFLEAQSSLDVRAMQLTHRQLHIMGSLSAREEYFLPMELGEEPALVHLTVENGSREKGGIRISVDYGEDAHLEARLQVQNGRLDGFLLGKTRTEVTKLQETSDIFYNLIAEDASLALEAKPLPVVTSENTRLTRMSESNSREDANAPDNGMLYHVAKLFLQAIQ